MLSVLFNAHYIYEKYTKKDPTTLKKECVLTALHIATASIIAKAIQAALPYGILATSGTAMISLCLSAPSTVTAAGFLLGKHYFNVITTEYKNGALQVKHGFIYKEADPKRFNALFALKISNFMLFADGLTLLGTGFSKAERFGLLDYYVFRAISRQILIGDFF